MSVLSQLLGQKHPAMIGLDISSSSVKLVAGALPEKLYAVPLVPPLNVPVALSVPVTARPVVDMVATTGEPGAPGANIELPTSPVTEETLNQSWVPAALRTTKEYRVAAVPPA